MLEDSVPIEQMDDVTEPFASSNQAPVYGFQLMTGSGTDSKSESLLPRKESRTAASYSGQDAGSGPTVSLSPSLYLYPYLSLSLSASPPHPHIPIPPHSHPHQPHQPKPHPHIMIPSPLQTPAGLSSGRPGQAADESPVDASTKFTQ